MQIIRTLRILPALVVALVALFVVASGSAMASTNSGHHHGPVASAAHHKKKPKKKKAPKPQAPKGPFVARDAGATSIGTGPDDTVIETLSLPAGANYIVTAKAELGNNGSSENTVRCQLLQGFNPLDSSSEALTPQATFSRTITLNSAVSGGGSIKLACQADKGAQARNRVITAVVS